MTIFLELIQTIFKTNLLTLYNFIIYLHLIIIFNYDVGVLKAFILSDWAFRP